MKKILIVFALLFSNVVFGYLTVPSEGQPVLIVKVQPVVNWEMLRFTEGFVLLSFCILKDGKPSNIELVDTNLDERFVRSAKNAVSKWKYKPAMNSGSPIVIRHNVNIAFEISAD